MIVKRARVAELERLLCTVANTACMPFYILAPGLHNTLCCGLPA